MKKKCVLINPATGKQCSKYRDGTHRICSMHRYREKNNRDLWTKRSRAERNREIAERCRMPSEEVDRLLATIDHVLVGEYVNSRTLVEVRHTCGRINKVTIGGIKQGYVTHGCRPCLVKNKKLLEMTHEEATKELKAYGFTPIEEYKGMNEKWRSIHDACGEEVAPTLGNLKQTITKGTTGCYYCQRQASADKRRATSETIATSLAEQNLYPIGEYVRSNDPFQVGCNTCGRDNLMMSYSDIKQGHGCVYCNGGPFTMLPTFLYLMKHTQKNTLIVGIAQQGKVGKRRLTQHLSLIHI